MRDRVSNGEADERPLVCIVDDDPSVRRQLERQLRLKDTTSRHSSRAQRFWHSPCLPGPRASLLDVRLSGISGLDLYKQLKQKGAAPPAVFLTGFGGVPLATRAMKDGAVDFLEKPVRKSVLLAAVRAALELSRQALAERSELTSLKARYESLTPREREVFDHVVTGQLNKQTAFDLGITEATIKVHRARVMQKMRAASVADLTLMALALGRVGRRPTPATLLGTRQLRAQA